MIKNLILIIIVFLLVGGIVHAYWQVSVQKSRRIKDKDLIIELQNKLDSVELVSENRKIAFLKIHGYIHSYIVDTLDTLGVE
jgi:predicted Holliday junction resolvase-like endonuclease